MRRAFALSLALGLLTTALPAFAKEAKPPQRVTFGDAVLSGTIERPELPVVFGTKRAVFVPMVPVRLDFQRELDRSVDAL